jgi:uncharacterized protein YaaR (DUF327 family)
MGFEYELAGIVKEGAKKETKGSFDEGVVPDKKAGEEKKEGTSSEEKIGKIDEIFDELLDKVKDAPEAQQEALKILIGQMRQIGEQLKQVRDIKNLHEIKKLMMKHWEELNELAKGNPELLRSIQNWGKKFVEEKVFYYELIEDIKDELIEKSQKIEEEWTDIRSELGKIKAYIDETSFFLADSYIEHFFAPGNGRLIFGSQLELFIKSLNNLETGHSEDVDLDSSANFMKQMSDMIMEMNRRAYELGSYRKPLSGEPLVPKRAIDLHPELVEMMKKVEEKTKTISRHMKESNKIYKVIKKIRDTHFLSLYNEQPEQIAA